MPPKTPKVALHDHAHPTSHENHDRPLQKRATSTSESSQAIAAHFGTPSPTMYNTLTRIQNVFGFFTTVAFVVAAFIAASDFTYDRTPSVELATTSVQV